MLIIMEPSMYERRVKFQNKSQAELLSFSLFCPFAPCAPGHRICLAGVSHEIRSNLTLDILIDVYINYSAIYLVIFGHNLTLTDNPLSEKMQIWHRWQLKLLVPTNFTSTKADRQTDDQLIKLPIKQMDASKPVCLGNYYLSQAGVTLTNFQRKNLALRSASLKETTLRTEYNPGWAAGQLISGGWC